MTFSEMFKFMTSPTLNFQAKNAAQAITYIPFVNPVAIVINIIGIIAIIVLLIFLFWWISDIVRTIDDVPFVNYEMLVFAATGTKDNLYKANAEILEDDKESESLDSCQETVSEEGESSKEMTSSEEDLL